MVVLSASAISQELGQLSLHVSSSSPQPLIRDGKFVGVTLSNVSENNFLKKVGLQSGDTVKSINGNSFSSPEEALSLLNNSSWANVTIERGGEDVQLSYVVDQNL
jgi:type II secretory pathway component PulC